MPAAAIGRQVPYLSPIHIWAHGPPDTFQDRLTQMNSGIASIEVSDPNSTDVPYVYPQSICSGSSMAHMPPQRHPILHQPRTSTASNRPPSLCHTVDTATDSSICTSVGNDIPGFRLLEEQDEGVLVQPPTEVEVPIYQCVFGFLDCDYRSQDREEWETHCLSHFRGKDPPCFASCPLCDEWKMSFAKGSDAWNAKMRHLANEHFAHGHNLSTSRPDFHLYTHLWQRGLISEYDLKELRGGNYHSARPPTNFVETERPMRRDRDERRERRDRHVRDQRLQHVSQGLARHL